MIINLSLTTWKARILVGLTTLAVCAVLVCAALWYVVVATLSDDRIAVPREVVAAAVQYFPGSPRLHARLASLAFYGSERDIELSEVHAREAVRLLPNEYSYRLLLGSILEAKGDRDAAEQSFRDAVALAPNYGDVHWRLANVLVRQGKAKESLDHFRTAAASNISLLPSAYDLIWNISNGSIEDVTYITGRDAKQQIALAQFLLGKNKVAEATNVYGRIDSAARRGEDESANFLTQMVAADHLTEARTLWLKLISDKPDDAPLVWNGGFENDIKPKFAQFDWQLASSDYARVAVDPTVGHSGARSLRVLFNGLDTTRLTNEVKQLVPVKAGARYRLEAYYKTRDLFTPMGPRVVVLDRNAQTVIAASGNLPEGSRDWQQIGIDFTAPANAKAVVLSFQRVPKYDYDNPTRGVVWLDDFALKEQ